MKATHTHQTGVEPATSFNRQGSSLPRRGPSSAYNPFVCDPFIRTTYEVAWKDLYRLYRQAFYPVRLARYHSFLSLEGGVISGEPAKPNVANAILREWLMEGEE